MLFPGYVTVVRLSAEIEKVAAIRARGEAIKRVGRNIDRRTGRAMPLAKTEFALEHIDDFVVFVGVAFDPVAGLHLDFEKLEFSVSPRKKHSGSGIALALGEFLQGFGGGPFPGRHHGDIFGMGKSDLRHVVLLR